MVDELRLIKTDDGSHTLFLPTRNETYHSLHGAITESKHVFIAHGIQFFIDTFPAPTVSILEIGFGTGLNALLTKIFSETAQLQTNFTTLEPYPIPASIYSQLNYPEMLNRPIHEFEAIHMADWEQHIELSPSFSICKSKSTVENFSTPEKYDLIFYDAFAPSKQNEIWDISIIDKLKNCLKPTGIIVSYCASGALKRNLRTLGFMVETLPGPPGKKEMTRAVYTGS